MKYLSKTFSLDKSFILTFSGGNENLFSFPSKFQLIKVIDNIANDNFNVELVDN